MINLKLVKNKKNGSAMIVVMLIFFAVFILSFGSGYVVFLNAYKSMDTSENIKAYNASLAGVDRAHFEVQKNNFDFVGNCSSNIFSETLSDDSSFVISCVDNSGDFNFYSTGTYKKSKVSVEIDCININEECLGSCKIGSMCGGGKLFKNNDISFVVSPSGCDAGGLNCDNNFSEKDLVNLKWDATAGGDNFNCGDVLTDSRDSQEYPTVLIGTQCWMAKNLAYLPSVQTNTDFITYGSVATPAYGVYGYTGTDVEAAKATANYQTYGVLYNWYGAVATSSTTGTEVLQGACPTGWHIPTSTEFATLSSYLGGDFSSGGKLKQTGEITWSWSGMGGATNSSGFTALPAGYRYYIDGTFTDMSYNTSFWSSLPPNFNAETRILSYNNTKFSSYFYPPIGGFSVRCLKDSSGPGDFIYNGADSRDNGKANSLILNPQVNTNLAAAKYCDDLVVNGFSDWYLPAVKELGFVGPNATGNYSFNLRPLNGENYWASNEASSSTPALAEYFNINSEETGLSDNKGSEMNIRCVRRDTSCSSKTVCGESCSYGGVDYETIDIGGQCWFKKNLNYDNGCSSNTWENESDTGWCGCFNDDPSNCDTYGRLYQWSAAMNWTEAEGGRGVCPSGWHIPSSSEQQTLNSYVNSQVSWRCGGTNNYTAKALSSSNGWTTSAVSCAVGNGQETNNLSGFNGLPAGYRHYYNGNFENLGGALNLLSSTKSGSVSYNRMLYFGSADLGFSNTNLGSGSSVRCLKN